MVNFKFYNVTSWLTNNFNTHIAQYLNIFLETFYTKCRGETSRRAFFEKLKLTISLDQCPKVL